MLGEETARTFRRIGNRVARLSFRGADEDWQLRYRALARKRGVDPALAGHRNAAALATGFNVGAYLAANPDVADAVTSAGEAVFHYLEFGHAEGRSADPETWDAAFVRRFHGLVLPEDLSAPQADRALRRAGVGPADAALTETHLWLALGVHGPVFEKIFEHEFYVVAAEAAGHRLPGIDRLGAIAHFCTKGLAEGIPPHPDLVFDPAFYREALALAGVAPPPADDPAALRRHWAERGVRAGAHANPRAWFGMAFGVNLPDSVLEALPAFRAASADLDEDAGLAATLHHLATLPVPGASVLDPGAPGVEGFLLDLARQRRGAGDPGAAEWLLRSVLDRSPGHPGASRDLADILFRQNRPGTEIQLRKAVPPGGDTGANGITLAERLASQGRWHEALEAAGALPDAIYADVALRRRRRDLGRAIFEAVWGDLGSFIGRMSIADVQRLLAEALALYTPPFEAPRRSGAIRKVAVLANDDLYQCKLYRADQKIDQLRTAGYEADLFHQAIDLERLRDRLEDYDAVIFVRVPALPSVIDVIVEAAQQGLATFYDCDDLIFEAAIFPPALRTYAGRITPRDHGAIACGVPLFRHAMSLCEHGIASTPTIRDAMQSVVRSGQVFLHRNALGRPHMQVLDRAARRERDPGGKLVIHYGSGTKAHKAEFTAVLEPAIAELLARRPGRVEVRLVGDFPALTHLDPEHPDLHLVSPIWDFETYCDELAGADIALSVLDPSILTDAKSEIKWMEAAMLGVPSVVSPTATYRDVVEDGVTGMIATDRAGFVAAMLALVDDPALGRRIGAAARDRVLRDYGLQIMGQRFDAMFETVRPAAARRKTRLLVVNVFYPPQDIGGATRVVQDNVADLLRLHGDTYEIDVVATLEGGERPYELRCHARDGARVWTVTARDGIDTMTVQDHRMADVFDRLLSRIRPELVHVHCIQRLTASVLDTLRRRDVPYVVTLHDGWWVSPNQFVIAADGTPETYDFRPEATATLPARARITRRGLAGAAAVLAVSDAFAEVHRTAGLTGIETVENGVSVLPGRVREPGPEGRVRLGHIGGAARHKGYKLLQAAIHARQFQNLDLVVVDHAMAAGQSRHEVWNGTPVLFLPRSPLSEVGRIYGQIDVLLAPSTWPESYGLVTREALGLGLWVVASDRGAIGADVVDGQNGFLVDVSDHHGLVAALARIDADPERFRAAPAHRIVPRSSADQAADLHAVYQRLLAARRD
ncbi:glycosyltransferase [Rhodobacterales bacterium HKCCSP123]|nr:glycosyltransferase [Rhodobacterales bacterium HKCCSP123]